MSFSWMKTEVKIKNKIETPSPTFASTKLNKFSREQNKIDAFMERISLLISGWKQKKLSASMTVEATLLIPLVLFFFLHLMGYIEMLRLHGKMSFALWECGNGLTVFCAMPQEVNAQIPDIAVSYLYVGNRLKGLLGKEYLERSPMVKGENGLNLLAAKYEGDCVDIGLTYQVEPPITLFPFPYMRMVNRYFAHDWSGYEAQKDLRYVYVTLYGEVWHASAECTHIFITVQEADKYDIFFLRNANGGKYYPCERCKKAPLTETVYFTDQGDRYHRDQNCGALTRYVSAVIWQESIPFRPCSRCVKEEEK